MSVEATSAWQEDSFRRGLTAGLGIALGYMPVALAFGFLAKGMGLSVVETMSLSIFVYAGAAQYMVLNMVTVGAGAFEMILSVFVLNIRHLLLSASLSERVEEAPKWIKAIYSFGITDEVFAVVSAERKYPLRTLFVFGVGAMAYGSWVLFTALGFVVGGFFPETLRQGMSIALYALFIALLLPAARTSLKVVLLATLAALCNVALQAFLAEGWAIIVATMISATIVAYLPPFQEQGGEMNS
ncbi:AzlC family ABC transporter permease [Shouchella shacheensis]|uniref:AzlC family ABC transporter permease n=1 Tax=Shouchella shacheensis TaxID=1649580 RepID=UPI00073FDF21|nr:AzlC family ABC transporter permease [Shouchella shacheensis]